VESSVEEPRPGAGWLLSSLADLALALLAVAGSTALVRSVGLNSTTVGLVLLVVVLGIALARGLRAAVIGAFAATLAFNFFFLPPLHTFTIAEPANWVALFCFLVVAVVVSRLVLGEREQAADALRRRREIEVLYELSIDLFTTTNRIGVLGEAATRALRSVGAGGGGLLESVEGSRPAVVSWSGRPLAPEHERLVQVVLDRGEAAEVPAPGGARDVYFPLLVGGKASGVLVVLGTHAGRTVLDPVARLVALAIERERFLVENAHLEALRQSESLKTSLLRAVSHDLRSPLTAIGLSIEGLRRRLAGQAEARAALDDLARESGRLARRIDNLLALARLEAGRSVPHAEPTPPADLFRATREALSLVLVAHPVHVSLASDCPDAFVDPSLVAEVLVNLVENAARAAPEGTAIELTAARHPVESRLVRLEVADRGPGVAPEALPGTEGELADGGRRGLGLEIARGLAAANGGHLSLHPRPGGGTVARVDLPAAEAAEGVET
jgi:two-component system, OmpR family, sensor histidine kinase KdpD